MIIWEEFEQELREALASLYDPDYQPSEPFCALLGCGLRGGPLAAQAAIARAIEDLEPQPNTPLTAYPRRVYDVLHNRFVLKLTQEETAERLHVSLSSVQRAQREAIHTLARHLWERQQADEATTADLAPPIEEQSQEGMEPGAQARDWRSQTRRELAALQSRDPDHVADVAQTLRGVLELESVLMPDREVHVEVGYVQPDLVAAVHPSVLRQTLISALDRLARHASSGPITIFARLKDGNARVTIRGPVAAGHGLTKENLIHDILVPEEGAVTASVKGDHAFLWIEVPSLGQVTVLAVDDNPDMLHFYRRCTTGTKYRIIHASGGQEALKIVRATPPDIIVLDVMLPDVDGWQLLMQLHEDSSTRAIPIVICSVVREEHLARTLGSAAYLPKPVEPRQFVDTLDQVRPRASAEDSGAPTNTAATG
jgi:CheY-like chemotaxis protein